MTDLRHHRVLAVLACTAALAAGCSSSSSSSTDAQSRAAQISKAVAAGTSHAATSAAATSQPAGTGSGGGGDGLSSTRTLCSLLSVAQVSALAHASYTGTAGTDLNDISTCEYQSGPGTAADLSISVTAVDECFAADKEANGPGTAISGVGDEAFGYSTGMAVRHGSTCIDITGTTPAEAKGDWSADTAIARALLTKLQ